jgi:hypothetical protein
MVKNGNNNRRKGRSNGARCGGMSRSNAQGPSTTPQQTLKRRFRSIEYFSLNNTTGNGEQQYAYYSKYKIFDPTTVLGFRDAAKTFELWRLKRAKVYIQMGYNSYNQTYNTVNLDAALSSCVWTAADFGNNESISGVDIQSYDNARFHSLSLNKFLPIVNTACRLNNENISVRSVLPASTWLDTATSVNANGMDTANQQYNGYSLFVQMPGMSATNYLPRYQLVTEYEVEFMQPAWQNISSTFDVTIMDATLDCEISDTERRVYKMDRLTREASGLEYHLVREDGQPGSLTYSASDMFQVFATGANVGYFGNRPCIWTGPKPLKD